MSFVIVLKTSLMVTQMPLFAICFNLIEIFTILTCSSLVLFYLFGVTVRRALPWPPNKHFSQVSQSGYTNVIDGHASLQSWRVKIILSSERFGLGR